MDSFVIEGGRPLEGTVTVEGVKNVILPMMCAALMADEGVTVINEVPVLKDIGVLQKLIGQLGAESLYDPAKRTLTIDSRKADKTVAPYELVKQMRASFSLPGRFSGVSVSFIFPCRAGAPSVTDRSTFT